MAIIRRQNQDLLNQEQDQQGQDKVVSTSTQSSQTPQSQPGQGAPAGGQIQKGPSTSGRFTNIQNFIRANKSGQIGQQVSQKVGAEAEKARKAVSEAKEKFESQYGASSDAVKEANAAVPTAISNIKNSDTAEQGIQDLTAASNVAYQGPSGLGNEAQLASQAQNLQSIGQAGKSEGGRFALLQRFFGRDRPTYSTGQTRLDNLLLGRQSDVLGKIAGEARAFGGEVRSEQEAAAKQARESQALAKETQELAKTEGNKAFTDLETKIVEEAASKADKELSRIRDQVVSSGILTTLGLPAETSLAEMEKLGLVVVPQSLKDLSARKGGVSQVSGANQQLAGTLGKLSQLLSLGKAYDSGAVGLEQGDTTTTMSSIPQQFQSYTQQAISNPEFYGDPQIQQSLRAVLDTGGLNRSNRGLSQKEFEGWKNTVSSILTSGVGSWNEFLGKVKDAGIPALGLSPGLIQQFISIRDNKAKKFASDSIRRQFGLPVAQGVDEAPTPTQAPTPVVEGGGFGRTQMIPVE